MMPDLLAQGRWRPDQVHIRRSPDRWAAPPALEARIDRLWNGARLARGKLLFDGPMARVDCLLATPERFDLHLSLTSYRPFYALQLRPELKGSIADPNDLPNPLGVSVVLLSADGQLLFGRRGANVAYHPNRIHPFAGSMEPQDGSPFDAALRELREEVGLTPDLVHDLALLGVVQDPEISQPEAVISARTTRTAREIQATLDPAEHDALVAIQAPPHDESELSDQIFAEFTPVCQGALLLWAIDYEDHPP